MSNADEDKKRRIANVQNEKNFTSSQISELSRYIAFGLAVLVFTLLTSDSAFAALVINEYRKVIVLAGFFSIISIMADYAQYFCGYLNASHVLETEEVRYRKSSVLYKLRSFLFIAKQVTALLSASVLVYVLMSIAIP